jgi:hypothetical protein
MSKGEEGGEEGEVVEECEGDVVGGVEGKGMIKVEEVEEVSGRG